MKSRVGTVLASAGVLAVALTLGLVSPASASSVPDFELRICSYGSFQTNAYYTGGGYLAVPAGQCRSRYFPNGPNPSPGGGANPSLLRVDAYVHNGGYIAGANVDVAKGAGLATGGSYSKPYLWSF